MNRLFGELKRRNVFRVAGVYAVAGWVVAQIANTLKETLGLPEWFDAMIVALLLLGFPIAIIFAWAFELTPEGVVRTEDVPEDQSITANTGRKLDMAIVIALFILVVMVVWQQVSPPRESPGLSGVMEETVAQAADASIAVLPFDDLSPEGDQEYFSDGIAEEILNVLVRVDGLDVASRTSSFQFRGRGLGIPVIAGQLNVRHIVEGSVRKSGDTIRVTAQLIDSSNDRHLWSDTYDSPLSTENIFHIQDEIAESIVEALSDALGLTTLQPIEVETTTRNFDAYELFLRARPMFHDRVNLDVADDLLARAVAQDPDFAEAWEIRAALQTLAREYGYSDVASEVSRERGLEMAEKALAISPRSATALAVIADTRRQAIRDLREQVGVASIINDFGKALAIDPRNASALNWRGLTYLHAGDFAAALHDFATCLGYEPYYRPCVENHFTVLGVMGRDEEATIAYLKALNTSSAKTEFTYFPSFARQNNELGFKMAMNGSEMLQGWRRHDDLWRAYQDPSGDHRELIASIQEYLESRQGGYADLFSYIAHPIGTGWEIPEVLVMWDPMMAAYRQTEPFKNYIRESGVHDYWREHGFPPQCRPLGGNDFECD
jgi:TolB-like protein/Tfp pilus assembly protein PilF